MQYISFVFISKRKPKYKNKCPLNIVKLRWALFKYNKFLIKNRLHENQYNEQENKDI